DASPGGAEPSGGAAEFLGGGGSGAVPVGTGDDAGAVGAEEDGREGAVLPGESEQPVRGQRVREVVDQPVRLCAGAQDGGTGDVPGPGGRSGRNHGPAQEDGRGAGGHREAVPVREAGGTARVDAEEPVRIECDR